MKKIIKVKESILKGLIKESIRSILKEEVGNIDLSFLNELVNKFQELQNAYNEFVISNNPFADFSPIADGVKQLTYEFDEKIKPTLVIISNIPEQEYDTNPEYYENIDNTISDLKNKVDNFEYEIEKASDLYNKFQNIQQKLTYF